MDISHFYLGSQRAVSRVGINLALRFNRHFPGEPGLASVY